MRSFMFKRSILVLSAALLLAAPMQGCSKKETPGKGQNPAAKPPEALTVAAVRVEGRTVDRTVEATGTLVARDEVAVSSDTAGTVSRVMADLGDRVKAGDALAMLDQREAKLALEQASAALLSASRALDREKARKEEAEANYRRFDELFRKSMVSASQFDSATAGRDIAEAQLHEAEARELEARARLELAKKKMSDTVVTSPISGEVSRRFVSVGEAIKEKAQMFTVVSSGALKFRGTVAESAVPSIRPGQPVILTVEAFRDRQFKGTLTRVSPALDASTRTLEIEAEVANPGSVLKPGFFAKGVILTRKEKGVPFVPVEALYSFVGINKVFVIEGGAVRELGVARGAKDGQMIELPGAPLKDGDMVAGSNLANLYDGAKVTVEGKR